MWIWIFNNSNSRVSSVAPYAHKSQPCSFTCLCFVSVCAKRYSDEDCTCEKWGQECIAADKRLSSYYMYIMYEESQMYMDSWIMSSHGVCYSAAIYKIKTF